MSAPFERTETRRPLRIGIDARYVFRDRRGIGNVLHNLLKQLGERDHRNSYFLFTDVKPNAPLLLPDNFRIVGCGPKCYPAWEQFVLPALCLRHRVDVLHCTGNTAPMLLPTGCRLVLTIHDLINFGMAYRSRSESLFKVAARLYSRVVIPPAVRSASAITTVSRYTRADILKRISGSDPSRITVIPNAESFWPASLPGHSTVPGLDGAPFFLCLGARDPRKNTPLIISAFLDNVHRFPAGTRLAIAGMWPGCAEAKQALARNPAEAHRVIFLGYVTDAALSALYQSCLAFLYLSRFEGFGMPLVDAMKHGCPIVCSNATSLPEVAGDAALQVDLDPRQVGAAMAKILEDPALRAELVSRGRRRGREFSWAASAERLLAIYESFAGPSLTASGERGAKTGT